MNPYEAQPAKAFWRNAVASRDPLDIDNLWAPKFSIDKTDPIVTLGSCFAQHISRALVAAGYNWVNAEPAPHGFSAADKAKYGYEVFSVRTSNIYTVALLRQWTQWALQNAPIPDEIWRENDRFCDPFRPTIEPNGFYSAEEALALRRQTVDGMRHMFETCRIFIFTLGLTEGWVNRQAEYVYPMCPGTVAGTYNPDQHVFKNYNMFEIHADLIEVLRLIRSVNKDIKVLLTVSPVPLTATASTEHVLNATIKSKSILRAVSASIVDAFDYVDYFPSYEIISSFPYGGKFYEANMRDVKPDGVRHVMSNFMRTLDVEAHADSMPKTEKIGGATGNVAVKSDVDVICEELMLDFYGR
jgi:hypothetical protein